MWCLFIFYSIKADFVNVNLPFALSAILIKLAAIKKFNFLVKIA